MKKIDKIFADYIKHLYRTSTGSVALGGKVRALCELLDALPDFTKKNYLAYKKSHEVLDNWRTHVDVCDDFASYVFRQKDLPLGTDEIKTVRGLQKLEGVSQANQDAVSSWISDVSCSNDYSKSFIRILRDGMLGFFGYAEKFTNENAKRYVQTLVEKGNKPATICLRITALRRYAGDHNIAISIKAPKIKKQLSLENIPSEAEYRRLLDYLRGKSLRDYIMVFALATTGARVSELIQFKIEDILNGEVVLRGKGNKYRRFFFVKSLQDEVRKLVAQSHESGYLFKSRYGDVITTRGVAEKLKRHGLKCKIDPKKMHPHAFRHFFAKQYLKKNKDIVALADLLGHGGLDTTRIYLQRTNEEQRRDFQRNVTW